MAPDDRRHKIHPHIGTRKEYEFESHGRNARGRDEALSEAYEILTDLVATDSDSGTLTPRDGSPGGCVTPSVFISYRREDCPGHAGRLFDHLRTRFGETSVFMDVTDIEAGVDFVDVLQRAVGSCDVLLAVIGREWLTCTDRHGHRRLDDPHDFIRLEVGIALARNVRVIPVLVEGAGMPAASELPSDLEGLTRRQAVELRDARWNADVESLAAVLERVLGSRTAGHAAAGNRPRLARLWGLAAVALVAAIAAVVTLVPGGVPTPYRPVLQRVLGTASLEEQRPTVQTRPPGSASSGRETTTNPSPATAQPIRAAPPPAVARAATTTAPPARPAPAPALPAPTTTVSPVREERDAVVSPDPTAPVTRASGGGIGWLGVQLVNGPADSTGAGARGALVRAVASGGPAATAGLLVGDLIVEYNGSPIDNATSLVHLAGAAVPGERVPIRVRRGDTGRTLEVVVGARAAAPVTRSVVMVYYAADDDRQTAEDLAAELRGKIGDPRYSVRTLKTPRGIGGEGEVRYSSSGVSTLAGTLARSAGSWLSRTYGRRVAFRPTVEPRVSSEGVIVIMPGRTPAPAVPPGDLGVTIAYPTTDDPKIAEELATFLRTRPGTKYVVKTLQVNTGPRKDGRIQYEDERMAAAAQVLSRDAAAWISRAYGRAVVLQPTKSGRIGANAVVLLLPSR